MRRDGEIGVDGKIADIFNEEVNLSADC